MPEAVETVTVHACGCVESRASGSQTSGPSKTEQVDKTVVVDFSISTVRAAVRAATFTEPPASDLNGEGEAIGVMRAKPRLENLKLFLMSSHLANWVA